MTNTVATTSTQKKPRFTPKMENFKIRLMYEGLSLKEEKQNQSIEQLKQKYAR
ncbi:MAG: hypothetical protein ACJASL_004806 [Paraglaciecola sp.]|jgi:hypothetical protein